MARVVVDQAALQTLTRSPAGPVGVYMARGGAVVANTSRSLALVDTGRMKGAIGWQLGSDGGGLFVDVMSPARSDRGFPYPIVVERKYQSHLEAALPSWPG